MVAELRETTQLLNILTHRSFWFNSKGTFEKPNTVSDLVTRVIMDDFINWLEQNRIRGGSGVLLFGIGLQHLAKSGAMHPVLSDMVETGVGFVLLGGSSILITGLIKELRRRRGLT
jgi:hypothetical protein